MNFPRIKRSILSLSVDALLLFFFLAAFFSCTNSGTSSGSSSIFGRSEQEKLLAKAEKLVEQEQFDEALTLLRRIQNEYTLSEEQSAKWNDLLERVADARVSAQKSIEQKSKAASRKGRQNTYRKRFGKKIPEMQRKQKEHESKIVSDP